MKLPNGMTLVEYGLFSRDHCVVYCMYFNDNFIALSNISWHRIQY